MMLNLLKDADNQWFIYVSLGCFCAKVNILAKKINKNRAKMFLLFIFLFIFIFSNLTSNVKS
ncbi:MAG: hypothetical protein CSB06_00295 [Bacteroidia bacterium]|nr:MAG: hypothetical protein CSB06_00295 [Bacteroidia bacterium]